MNSISTSCRSTPGVVIEQWTPFPKNSLRGFVRAKMPSGTIFHDCTEQHGKWWVSPASKPMVQDGVQLKDQSTGRLLWSPVVTFSSKETRDRFSAAILDALRAAQPEVFGDEH